VPSHWLTPAVPQAAAAADSDGGRKRAGSKGKGKGKNASSEGKSSGGQDASSEKVSAAALENLAARAENDGDIGTPLAPLLRQAAARMKALETQVGEFGHSIQQLHSLSGRTLAVLGTLGVNPDGAAGEMSTVFAEEPSQSYMQKKASQETQEIHQATEQRRPAAVLEGVTATLSTTEKTKEEMELARKARLDRLEAQQAEKKKQHDAAAMKSEAATKSHRAMFSTQVGPTKQLGQL